MCLKIKLPRKKGNLSLYCQILDCANRSRTVGIAGGVKIIYTERESKIGNFAHPGAPDLRSPKQPISEGDMGDAGGLKDGDAGQAKDQFLNLLRYKSINSACSG